MIPFAAAIMLPTSTLAMRKPMAWYNGSVALAREEFDELRGAIYE
jgi:hypothetical protein